MLNNTMTNTPVRSIKAKVELYEGSTLANTFTYDGDLISIKIERVGDESKFFGFGICQKTNIHLRDMNRAINITTAHSFKIYFSYNDGDYVCNFPIFYTTEVHRDENTNELSITAYDALYKNGSTHTVNEASYTNFQIKGFLSRMAYIMLGIGTVKYVGCDIANDPAFAVSYNVEKVNFEGSETIREGLDAAAETVQCIYYLDGENKLVFRRINCDAEPDLTIGKADYFTLKSGDNRRLTTICSATELGDNVSHTTGETGTTQYLRDNPFWVLRDDVGDLVQMAVNAVGGFTIGQFDCKWRGNFLLEIGDEIAIETKDGEILTSYVLNDVIEYDGGMSQHTQWNYTSSEAETESNPATLGETLKQTYARVDKVNKEITLVASETGANTDAISVLQVNTESISSSVSDLQTITEEKFGETDEELVRLETLINQTEDNIQLTVKEEILNEIDENGVSSVRTETGFTFNKEGLTVSKSGSSLTTTITEDGMLVKRDNDVVLTANNDGVDAKNLHATTYLFVGVNSRFQDYDNNTRTGCFWVGK